jgi:hypothetical protein
VTCVNKTMKMSIGAILLVVAFGFGFFAYADFTANSSPSMGHVYNLVYLLAIVATAFLISGIWLMVSSFKLPK